jgi:hypothetical protein
LQKRGRKRGDLSGIRQGIPAKEFPLALFAAKKHFFPSEIDGLRLAFGDIALADRVLHQHLPSPLEVLSPFLLREKGLFYSPVNDS